MTAKKSNTSKTTKKTKLILCMNRIPKKRPAITGPIGRNWNRKRYKDFQPSPTPPTVTHAPVSPCKARIKGIDSF